MVDFNKLKDGDVYIPDCPFCRKQVYSYDKSIGEKDGWYHELCWWKKECARLTAVVDELKGNPDGSYSPLRPAVVHGDLESDPTCLALPPASSKDE